MVNLFYLFGFFSPFLKAVFSMLSCEIWSNSFDNMHFVQFMDWLIMIFDPVDVEQ